MTIAQPIALISTGLVAGVFLGHRAGGSRAYRRLDPGSFILLQQGIHQTFQWMMPPLLLAAVLGTPVWARLLWVRGPAVAFWLVVVAAVCMLVAAGATRVVNVPINRLLMSWSSETPPANLRHVWDRWEGVHSIRTVLALVAFVCQALALSVVTGGSP